MTGIYSSVSADLLDVVCVFVFLDLFRNSLSLSGKSLHWITRLIQLNAHPRDRQNIEERCVIKVSLLKSVRIEMSPFDRGMVQ